MASGNNSDKERNRGIVDADPASTKRAIPVQAERASERNAFATSL
jgi:hypothetical protein